MPTIPKRKAMSWEAETVFNKPSIKHNSLFDYKTYRWKKASINHRKNNPLCVDCLSLGIPEIGSVTDHDKPIGTPGLDPWDSTNWLTRCDMHHNQKRRREKGLVHEEFNILPYSEDIFTKYNRIFIIGKPASGKTTFVNNLNIKGFEIIHTDEFIESSLSYLVSVLNMYDKYICEGNLCYKLISIINPDLIIDIDIPDHVVISRYLKRNSNKSNNALLAERNDRNRLNNYLNTFKNVPYHRRRGV